MLLLTFLGFARAILKVVILGVLIKDRRDDLREGSASTIQPSDTREGGGLPGLPPPPSPITIEGVSVLGESLRRSLPNLAPGPGRIRVRPEASAEVLLPEGLPLSGSGLGLTGLKLYVNCASSVEPFMDAFGAGAGAAIGGIAQGQA